MASPASGSQAPNAPSLDRLIPGQRFLKWIIAGLPSLSITAAAFFKLTASPEMVANMKGIPDPELWLPRLGVITLISLALYWIPRTALVGTILLTAYLGGAAATHLLILQNNPASPILHAVLFWVGLGMRYPRVMAAAGLLPQR
ncbi:MAG: DoxX family protein [Acidobacteria bacterium]|nr:DoxX family protein [Acidobacteriota bacterium]